MPFSPVVLLRRIRGRLHRPGWRGWFSIVLCTLVAAVLAAWAIDYRTLHDDVSRNVVIEDIDIGRLHGAELSDALERADAVYGEGTVDFVIKGEVTSLKAADIGLTLDEEATLAEARRVGRDDPMLLKPVMWASSFFVKRHAPVRIRLDEKRLAQALADLPGQTAPVEPKVVGTTGAVGVRAGKGGYGFAPEDVSSRIARVARDGTLPIRVPLAARPTSPRVSMDTVKLLAVEATELTSSPITLVAPKGTMVVEPAVMRTWVTSKVIPGTDQAELVLDSDLARTAVIQQLGRTQIEPVDAAFTVGTSGAVEVVADIPGQECCTEQVGVVLLDALRSDLDEVSMPLEETDAEFTVDDADKLGITTLLGPGATAPADDGADDGESDEGDAEGNEPSTSTASTVRAESGEVVVPLPGSAGVRANVRTAIPKVRGRIIMPDKMFSLNTVLGAPSPANGYAPAAVDTPDGPTWVSGGGTDLLAAALFKAAYLGGLDIPASQRHGALPGGVEAGVEATLGWTEPDLVLRNPSKHAVLIWVDEARGGVRVRLYSTPFTSSVTSSVKSTPFGPERKCLAVTATRTRTFTDGRTQTDTFEARYTPAPGARDDPDRVICPN